MQTMFAITVTFTVTMTFGAEAFAAEAIPLPERGGLPVPVIEMHVGEELQLPTEFAIVRAAIGDLWLADLATNLERTALAVRATQPGVTLVRAEGAAGEIHTWELRIVPGVEDPELAEYVVPGEPEPES